MKGKQMNQKIDIPKRDPEHERLLGIVFNLSPAQSAVLSFLSRGTVATGAQLLAYSKTVTPIKITVSRVRTKLKEQGMDIKSKPNVGYWMEAEDRADVQLAVQNFLEGA